MNLSLHRDQIGRTFADVFTPALTWFAVHRDLIEKILATLFMGAMTWRVIHGIVTTHGSWVSTLVCVPEFLVVVFLLIRRSSSQVSSRHDEWVIAFGATLLPTLVQPGGQALMPVAVGLDLFIIAIVAQMFAKLSLNRSFGIVPANRGVVTTGFYGIVRHPVYATYLLGHVTFLLLNPTLWNVMVYAVGWTLQILRIRAEEGLLAQDPAYREYQQLVRYRLVPGLV